MLTSRWALLAVLTPCLTLVACSSGDALSPRSGAHVSATGSPGGASGTLAGDHTTPVNPVGTIKHVLRPGGYLDGLAVAGGALWVSDLDGDRVVRFDVSSLGRLSDVAIPDGPLTVVAYRGAVWVASYQGRLVTRLDARTGTTTATVTTPSRAPCGVAPADGRLWVFDQSDGAGLAVDAKTGRVLQRVKTPALSGLATTAFGSVWVPDFAGPSGAVQRLDATTGKQQATIRTGQGPILVSSGAGSVWVANATASTVSRVDPATGKVTARISLPGASPVAVLVTHDAAWVTGYSTDTLYRVDLSTDKVIGRLSLPGPPENMVVAGGLLWVTMTNGEIAGIAMAA